MSLFQIDFAQATDFTEATRWVFDPDKDVTLGSALRHVYIQQKTSDIAAVTGYCTGRVWMQRNTPAQGVIGTSYLYDGEDVISRVSKQDIWKRNALRLGQARDNTIKLDCVQRIDADGNVISAGNINVTTYGGDLEDFVVPVAEEYVTLCSCDSGFDLRAAAKVCSEFSALRGDTANRAVWFCVENNSIRMAVTERSSDRGIAMLTMTVPSSNEHELRFGIQGRHLLKAVDVLKERNFIGISVDDPENPKRVRFFGDAGWVDLPVVEDYFCRALSQGAMSIFLGENYEVQLKEPKTFDIEELLNGISIQTPKKGATRNDVVLELEEQQLHVYKRSDIRKSEISKIGVHGLVQQEWLPIVADHTYLTDCIEAVEKFHKQEERRAAYLQQGFEFGPDAAEEQQSTAVAQVVLTQATGGSADTNLLYIEPPTMTTCECRAVLIVNTRDLTEDYNEAD